MARLIRTNTTLLLVCEGYSEVELARTVRDIYLPRGCGISLQAENRRGYGGAATLELAIQRSQERSYDHFGVLIDTDQHWTDAERALAAAHGIFVIECVPCLEAMLLCVDGKRTRTRTSENKAEFERAYGGPASREGVIKRNFSRAKFDNARARVTAVNQLLTFLSVG